MATARPSNDWEVQKEVRQTGKEAIPGGAIHYFRDVEVVDTTTGETIETIEGSSTQSGLDAVRDANKQFEARFAEREHEKTKLKRDGIV